ncbi:CTP:phosphoglutamine cytidylyltransferase [Neobacillus rhizosphaerae]|uniref:CTP:phosphoglutamine cytidylyltransferase n=1 Tax=Neobacillus rhizosphaerae TaxID=2880965 RepID=A0ABM9EPI1_9BACI|nr:sugar phosphate nucleotidyltransferase [Neobacillus rhizosphaerae]CAH2714538.1 CTP:phosphoglutamine cytidylyltransferase [Neobacillus rhizosphaerae]
MKAIILAAGMGTRLRPLTNDTPKSLVKVAGEPMIERQIKFLKEKGIHEIIVVTGYLHEKFDYLKEAYGVTLIHNNKYNIYNNIYTMYLVKDYLQDAYVTEADVFMTHNFFKTDMEFSTYFAGFKQNFKQEWILKFDMDDRIHEIVIDDGSDYIIAGVSYWTQQDGLLIKEKLEEVISNGHYEDLYWDNIVQANLSKMNVKISKINSDDWFEIDSLADLEHADNYLLSKTK